jgi:hypothetical protein
VKCRAAQGKQSALRRHFPVGINAGTALEAGAVFRLGHDERNPFFLAPHGLGTNFLYASPPAVYTFFISSPSFFVVIPCP